MEREPIETKNYNNKNKNKNKQTNKTKQKNQNKTGFGFCGKIELGNLCTRVKDPAYKHYAHHMITIRFATEVINYKEDGGIVSNDLVC